MNRKDWLNGKRAEDPNRKKRIAKKKKEEEDNLKKQSEQNQQNMSRVTRINQQESMMFGTQSNFRNTNRGSR